MKTSFIELKKRNILSKEQMQYVIGGGKCGVKMVVDGVEHIKCDLSINDVQFVMDCITEGYDNPSSFNWCCDSCSQNGGHSSYC